MARLSAMERWELKVDKSGDCWIWTGCLVNDNGYGAFRVAGRNYGAHRWGYEQLVGPVPDGMELDHICHTRDLLRCLESGACLHRRCVNPDHLEPVTRLENVRRSERALAKTHCSKGHEYTPENTAYDRGAQVCRTCKNAYARAYYHSRKRVA